MEGPLVGWQQTSHRQVDTWEVELSFLSASPLGIGSVEGLALSLRPGHREPLLDISESTAISAILFCSRRLMKIMTELMLNVEFLSIDIYAPDVVQKIETIYIAHFLTHLECARPELSSWDIDEHGVRSRVVLDRNLIADHRAFVVHWEGPWFVAVREDVKIRLESDGVTNSVFKLLETQ